MFMPKLNFVTALFAKSSSLNGDDRHAPAGPGDLTAFDREQIAAQIRAIATRAANDYHRRCEQIPPYVLSAMKCGLNDWQALPPVETVTQPIQGKWKVPVLELAMAVAILAMGIFAVHRYKSEQANHVQMREQLMALRQQNGDMLQRLDKLKHEAASVQETLLSRIKEDQSRYRSLKNDSDQERRELRALREAVLASSKQVSLLTNQINPDHQREASIPAQNMALDRLRLVAQPQRNHLYLGTFTPVAEGAVIRFAANTQEDDICANQSARRYELGNTSSQSAIQKQLKSISQPTAQTPDWGLLEDSAATAFSGSLGSQYHAYNNRAAPAARTLSKK